MSMRQQNSTRENQISIICLALKTLGAKLPFSSTLEAIITKGFKPLNQCDAYEVLRYLINACKEEKHFKELVPKIWKNTDSGSKVLVEKYKKNILDAIKDLHLTINDFSILKKSHLTVPNQPIFYAYCLALVNYALNFQLKLLESGSELLGPSYSQVFSQPSLITLEDIETQKDAIAEEIKSFHGEIIEVRKNIKNVENELSVLKVEKEEAHRRLSDLIEKCPSEFQERLRNPETRSEAILSFESRVSEVFERNAEKLTLLKEVDHALDFLINVFDNSYEKVTINGEELYRLLPYETIAFAEKEGIVLFVNGVLRLEGLFDVVKRTLHDCLTDSNRSITRLLQLKPLPLPVELLKRAEATKCQLVSHLNFLQKTIVNNVNEEEAISWLNNFFIQVPSIEFNPQEPSSSNMREPIVDLEKIQRIMRIQAAQTTSKPRTAESLFTGGDLKSHISKTSNLSEAFTKPRYMRRRSKSSTDLILTDSSQSTVRNESTASIKSSYLSRYSRRSLNRSLWNLTVERQAQSALLDSSAFASSIRDGICSTRKVPEMFFEGDKSISPISSPQCDVSVQSSQKKIMRNSEASELSPSLLNSSLTPSIFFESNTSCSANDTRDTFENSGASFEFPDISCSSEA